MEGYKEHVGDAKSTRRRLGERKEHIGAVKSMSETLRARVGDAKSTRRRRALELVEVKDILRLLGFAKECGLVADTRQ
jgi:hypothetical protein